MVEQLICNQQVGGSNPSASSIVGGNEFYLIKLSFCRADRMSVSDMERYPSGQREQTVNLSAQPSEVRILPSPRKIISKFAGIAQLARASAFQAEGCGFESRFPLQNLFGRGLLMISLSCAYVAQSAEHILGKDEVTGSIPVVGSL